MPQIAALFGLADNPFKFEKHPFARRFPKSISGYVTVRGNTADTNTLNGSMAAAEAQNEAAHAAAIQTGINANN
jgi:hypothetical protein